MKKKTIIIGVIAIIAIFGVFKLKEYYSSRYEESDVIYVKVPESQSTAIDDLYDDSGKAVDKGKEYEFVGYNDKGTSRTVSFSFQTEDESKLLKPGQYLKVSVSESIVLTETVINESDVPQSVLKLFK